MTEYDCEALYGQHGPADVAYAWSEEYMEEFYRKNHIMFENIPNLRGACPWVLFDFRSPTRCHPQHQDGWNRKGLVSDKGQRKKAWRVVKSYFDASVVSQKCLDKGIWIDCRLRIVEFGFLN